MSSFSADALITDAVGMAFLSETIDAERRSDDAFAKAFDPSSRSAFASSMIARAPENELSAMFLQHEPA